MFIVIFFLIFVPMSFVGCGKKRGASITKVGTSNKSGKAGASSDVSATLAPVFQAIGTINKEANPVEVVQGLPIAIARSWKGSKPATTQKSNEIIEIAPRSAIEDGYWAVVFSMPNRKIHVSAPVNGKPADVTDQACEDQKSRAKKVGNNKSKDKLKNRVNQQKNTKKVNCDKIVAAANCIDGGEECRHLLTLVSVTPAKKTDGEAYLLAYYYHHTEAKRDIKEAVEIQVPQSLKKVAQESLKVREEDGAIIAKKFVYRYSALLFNPNFQMSELNTLQQNLDPAVGDQKNYLEESAAVLMVVPSADTSIAEEKPGDENGEETGEQSEGS